MLYTFTAHCVNGPGTNSTTRSFTASGQYHCNPLINASGHNSTTSISGPVSTSGAIIDGFIRLPVGESPLPRVVGGPHNDACCMVETQELYYAACKWNWHPPQFQGSHEGATNAPTVHGTISPHFAAATYWASSHSPISPTTYPSLQVESAAQGTNGASPYQSSHYKCTIPVMIHYKFKQMNFPITCKLTASRCK